MGHLLAVLHGEEMQVVTAVTDYLVCLHAEGRKDVQEKGERK